ncbi:hypothetical protein MJD09_22805 [bacterium]|nr:hypothetical protein [bacterium]
MHLRVILLSAFCTTMIFASTMLAQGRISGYMFGDFYYVGQNHDSAMEGKNGFWFRRIYLTYDQSLSDEFSVRFRMEMNSPGDFTSSSKLEPALKDGYVQWKRSGQALLLGISGTPTWGYLEKFWGYRSVEKTPADLYKFGSSRDFGIAAKGKLGASKNTFYHVMFGNGSSNKSETNDGKKFAVALGQHITKQFSVEVYTDFEERPGHTNRLTYQGFAGFKTDRFRLGAQYLHQTRKNGGPDEQLQIVSVFAVTKLQPKLSAFARWDRSLDAISAGPDISYLPLDGSAKFNFFLAGLDFTPHKDVHLMPNFEVVRYDEVAGSRPNTDVIPRVSFYYTWK